MIGSLIFLDIFFLSHHLLETTLTLISSLFAGDFDDFIFLFQELNDEFIFYHLNFLLEWYIYWICYYCWIFWWLNEDEMMRWISNVHFKKLKNWEIWLWKDIIIFEILVDFIIIINFFHLDIWFFNFRELWHINIKSRSKSRRNQLVNILQIKKREKIWKTPVNHSRNV